MGGGLNAGEGAGVTVCVRQWKSCLLSALYSACDTDLPFWPNHIYPDLTFYFEAVGEQMGGGGMLTNHLARRPTAIRQGRCFGRECDNYSHVTPQNKEVSHGPFVNFLLQMRRKRLKKTEIFFLWMCLRQPSKGLLIQVVKIVVP